MGQTEAQKRATRKYAEAHYKVVTINLKKEFLADLQDYADERGLSLAQGILTLALMHLGIKRQSIWQKLKFAFCFDGVRHKEGKTMSAKEKEQELQKALVKMQEAEEAYENNEDKEREDELKKYFLFCSEEVDRITDELEKMNKGA